MCVVFGANFGTKESVWVKKTSKIPQHLGSLPIIRKEWGRSDTLETIFEQTKGLVQPETFQTHSHPMTERARKECFPDGGVRTHNSEEHLRKFAPSKVRPKPHWSEGHSTRQATQKEPFANGSVHTGCKEYHWNYPQICVLVSISLLEFSVDWA